MKINFTHSLSLVIAIFSFNSAFSQAVGDYQSISAGDWSNISHWERYDGTTWQPAVTVPTSADGVITITSAGSITVGLSAVTADQVVVDPSATLIINNTFTLSGIGTAATVNGTITVFSTINGTGNMLVNGVLDWTGGGLAVPTDLTTTGTCNLSGANKDLNSSLTIANGATVNWSASSVNFNNGTLTNNGTIIATGDNFLTNVSGTNLFHNTVSGVVTKNTGTGQSNIDVPFTNDGTINVNSGTFRKPNSATTMVNTGTINLAGGTTFSVAFVALTLNPGTNITGTGIFQIFSTGTSSVNLPLSIPAGLTFRLASGTLGGSGSIAVNGSFDWYAGILSVPVTINAGASLTTSNAGAKSLTSNLTIDGTFNWTQGNFTLTNATVTVNNSFIANLAASQFFNGTGSSLNIASGATLSKTSTVSSILTSNIGVTNNGIISGIGTINFTGVNGTVTNNGEVQPGNSPGILTINSLMLNANTPTLRLQIVDGSGAGTGHDRLDFNATGTIDVSGTALIVQENTSAPLTTYIIMDNTAGGGAFINNFASINIPIGYTLNYTPGTSTSISVTKNFITLPAVWGDFTALAKNNNQINLIWSTLQESNVSHYTVEYSTNGRDYSTITSIPAVGHTNRVTKYSFTHATPDLKSNNFYRIRQFDLDGRSEYSITRPVRFNNGKVVTVIVSPNPASDKLQLSIQVENVHIALSDLSGKILQKMDLQPGNHDVNISTFARGVYLLTIYQNGRFIESQKIIKQ